MIFTHWQGNVSYQNFYYTLILTTTSDSVQVRNPAGMRSYHNSA